jgi:hypothetical protein
LTSVEIISDELINWHLFSESVDVAAQKFPPSKKIPGPNTALSIPQNAKNLSIVKAMLAAIDPDPYPTGNRPRWRSCIWALASLSWGTVGCALAKKWSKSGDLYDETDFYGVWNKFEEGRGTSVDNLVQYARSNGYAGELFGAPQRGLIAIPASQIEPQPINWLLQDSIPLGAMVVVAGQPGMGKSQIALKLAAVATTGVGLPNGANFSDIGSVIVLANEDDAARTIRPRLDAVGADIEKVHIIQGVARNHDGLDYFRLDQDIQHLNALVAKLADVRLIIIDPPSAYLGAKIDAYKDSDVRRVLAPLGTLAQNTGALVLLVVHLNKRTDGNAQQRITGSTAWLAAPRAAFLAAEDAKTKNRYLLPVKNNLGNDKTGWQYEIREKLLPYTNLSIKAPHIEWLGESLLSASDILDKKPTKPVSVVDEAKEFLKIELSAGSLMTNDIKARASQAGHSWASVKRAKSELPVRSITTGTSWQWELQQ